MYKGISISREFSNVSIKFGTSLLSFVNPVSETADAPVLLCTTQWAIWIASPSSCIWIWNNSGAHALADRCPVGVLLGASVVFAWFVAAHAASERPWVSAPVLVSVANPSSRYIGFPRIASGFDSLQTVELVAHVTLRAFERCHARSFAACNSKIGGCQDGKHHHPTTLCS